jgi:cell division protein FtsB
MTEEGNKKSNSRILGITRYQWLIILALIAMLFFFSDNSIFKRIKYEKKIRDLKSQIEFYQSQADSNRMKLKELKSNKYDLEKFARENYFMKKDSEDVFVIE